MRVFVTRVLLLLGSVLALTPLGAAAQPPTASFLCDPAFEDCRDPLIELIDAETQGIDVGFWFMQDTRFSSALIRAKNRGIPVRVILDQRAFSDPEFSYAGAEIPIQQMATAGIALREKIGSAGIYHNKMMLFAGQNFVEFSGANYSSNAFVPNTPYADYVDEVIVFTNEPAIVNSFKTHYDNMWTDVSTGNQKFKDYANVPLPLARHYPTYPIDPELNFPPYAGSANNFASRSVSRYKAETIGIDSIMYRITDQRHTNEMIAAAARGVPVRLLSEPQQYRSTGKLWHSWNIDRMYIAGLQYQINGQPGIQIRHRKHLGLSHEKLTILKNQHMAIIGSSNWTSASGSASQHEHNIFSTRSWIYDWSVDHFNRKWDNAGPVEETEPFVPLPPDAAVVKLPADAAQNQPLALTLKWYAGPWAHKYQVLFGTSPSTMVPITPNSDGLGFTELGPSESTSASEYRTWNVTGLTEGTTYYWKVISRTMANLERSSATWSFRTQGAAPSTGSDDVVLWAWKAPSTIGWNVENDTSAAGGKRLTNPNLGAPKASAPLDSPSRFFELGFVAQAGVPYRLWIRGKAASNNYNNDSVYAQFNDSVTSTGAVQWRIGTTSGTAVTIEDCSGCGLANWGWNDNAIGSGVLGPLVYFENTGAHTLRIQEREDGLMIDQIILSPATFLNTSPGVPQSDGNIYSEQNTAPLDGNAPPTVSISSPPAGSSYTSPAAVEITATASDIDGLIARVEFLDNGTLLGTDTTSPYSFSWNANTPGSHTLTVRAFDNMSASTSATRNVTVNAGSTLPGEEVNLYAINAPTAFGWNVVPDTAAAGGARLQNPNAAAAKTEALAAPALYFEMSFEAEAGQPYHLWIRGLATSNSWQNDSVHVQFDNSVTAAGAPIYRIGTTSATAVTLEDCSGCGMAGWGWSDNAIGAMGSDIYFASSGTQTIRVQVREDGLGIDQVFLSPSMFLTGSPGATKNDTAVYPEQAGIAGTPNTPPTVSLTAPEAGALYTAPADVTIAADAADVDGTIARVDFYANSTLVGSTTTAPYSVVWQATTAGSYTLTAKAIDDRGTATTSAGRSITVEPGPTVPGEEIVLYASPAAVTGAWSAVADAAAAGGARLQNPNADGAKLEASATPADYFELTFDALAGRGYRLWVRGKSTGNSWKNDSAYAQFSGSVTSDGLPAYRIGTDSATAVTIEECTGCGLSGWGWNDNAVDGLGPLIYFETDGPQTIRVQVREDGLGIDQIVLSSTTYLGTAPGAAKNDATILPATP